MKKNTAGDAELRSPGEPSIEELAARQGVAPVGDYRVLLGTAREGDETPEEFAAMLRGRRREGVAPVQRG